MEIAFGYLKNTFGDLKNTTFSILSSPVGRD
jgi:hypothetical protein